LSPSEQPDFTLALKNLLSVRPPVLSAARVNCRMRNHFHLVLAPPNANLVAGLRWLLSAYTLRLKHRQKLFGHVFSGRSQALQVEGSGNGYRKTACDYVYLNPIRAGLLGKEDRLLPYP
ncbi:MAG: hypothetical protein WCQ21_36905, partial [Verrucomicrobiota bacterium]